MPEGGVISVVDLGVKDYNEALYLQRALREQRITGSASDTLLLLEHPPTITRGRRTTADEFRVSQDELTAQGFQVFDIERGGKSTYHGPGQLVGYPIIDLKARGIGVPEFVNLLEQTIIDYLATLWLKSARRPGYPGVWVGENKIAALGVHLKQWVSIHGFALNVEPDIRHFDTIIACGIADAGVTSVAKELARGKVLMSDVQAGVAKAFSSNFRYEEIQWHNADVFTDRVLKAK